MVLLTALLFGCASRGVPAGNVADADGQSLAAKPGYARVYLVSGFFLNQDDTADLPPVAGRPLSSAIGAGVGSAIRLATAAPEEYLPGRGHVPTDFFIDGQTVGRASRGQYLAVDLSPGAYTISCQDSHMFSTTKCNEVKLTLSAGDVKYFSSDWDVHKAESYLDPCVDTCFEIIQNGRRTAANWPQAAQTAKQ